MTAKHDQLVIVQKYETFLAYVYPIAQNLPRKHGVAKEMFLRDMLGQVELFIAAAEMLDNNGVEQESLGQAFLAGLHNTDPSHHVLTHYPINQPTPFPRGKYAGFGDLWDGVEFTSPVPPDPEPAP